MKASDFLRRKSATISSKPWGPSDERIGSKKSSNRPMDCRSAGAEVVAGCWGGSSSTSVMIAMSGGRGEGFRKSLSDRERGDLVRI